MARAESFILVVDPAASSVDLTAAGYVFGKLASTLDTQTMPLGGVLTLDIVASEGVVESVDFVSLAFDYLVDPNNPTIFTFTILAGLPGEGAETQFILPWGTIPPAGNPVTVFDPQLSLGSGTAGVETGTGGELVLTGPVFSFVGTGQYQNSPNVADGWPINLGPYPLGDTFPGAPDGPNELAGVVTVVGDKLVFNGTFLSVGRGGAGALQTAMIHTGVVSAMTLPLFCEFAPPDFDLDCDVDGEDVSLFLSCLTGPAVSLTPGCESRDLDLDADADLGDFAAVQRCFAGEGVEVDPNCVN